MALRGLCKPEKHAYTKRVTPAVTRSDPSRLREDARKNAAIAQNAIPAEIVDINVPSHVKIVATENLADLYTEAGKRSMMFVAGSAFFRRRTPCSKDGELNSRRLCP